MAMFNSYVELPEGTTELLLIVVSHNSLFCGVSAPPRAWLAPEPRLMAEVHGNLHQVRWLSDGWNMLKRLKPQSPGVLMNPGPRFDWSQILESHPGNPWDMFFYLNVKNLPSTQ